MSKKKLASIRRGIAYQDLVAAEAILDMVIDTEPTPLWVSLENRRGGSFDDVVIGYPKLVVWKQVKWAANPVAEPLTIGSLAKATQRRKTPLIHSFATSFQTLRKTRSRFRLELITNRSPDSEFRALLTGTWSKVKATLTKAQQKKLDSVWRTKTGLSKADFNVFLRTLSFLVNSPDSERLKRVIQIKLKQLRCGDSAFQSLMDAIGAWATDDEKDRITRDDVLSVLNPAEIPSNDFDLPERRVDRSELKGELCRRIDSVASGYVVVLGSPGSGKSTLLNTLHEGGDAFRDYDVIVYNCFTGTSDRRLRTRALADNFAKYLSRKLYELYLDFGSIVQPDQNAIESIFARLASCTRTKKLVLVVDGLDYAFRNRSNHAPNVFDSLPISLPENVVVVVSAQVAEQLPEHLRKPARKKALQIPPFDDQQVRELLDRYAISERSRLPEHELRDLVLAVLNRSGGHALLVNYIARQLSESLDRDCNVLQIAAAMPEYKGNVEGYYEQLFFSPDSALAQDALSVLAAAPFEMTAREIAAQLGTTVDFRSVSDALRGSTHLFEITAEAYQFTHDSLRVYALDHLPRDRFTVQQQVAFLKGLTDDPRTGEHLLHLLAEHNPDLVPDEVDCDWLARQIAFGANTSLLHEGLKNIALAHLRLGDWDQTVRHWSLMSCLEKSSWDGSLYEQTVLDAWLSMRNRGLAERYIFVTGQHLSSVWPGPDVIDLLIEHGYEDLAEKVADRTLSQSIPGLGGFGPSPLFERHIRHLGLRLSPAEIVAIIGAKTKAAKDHLPDHSHFTEQSQIERYSQIVAYECLDMGDLDRVAAWLELTPTPFDPDTAADLTLRYHLERGDIATHRHQVSHALEHVSVSLLALLAETGQVDDEVRTVLTDSNLCPLLSNNYQWLDFRASAVRQLYDDLFLSYRMGLEDRVSYMESLAHVLSNRVAHLFVSSLCQVAKVLAESPGEWKTALDRMLAGLQGLVHLNIGVGDIRVAEAFVGCLGLYLEPIALSAKNAGEAREFGQAITEKVLDLLTRAHFGYETGWLSICDLFLANQMCSDIVLRLLAEVEERFNDSIEFKSGSLIQLSTRYSRAGDSTSAQRALVAGVRAAFTYAYRKDTTINNFILALEAVGDLLGERFEEVARFTTSVLLILDELTDGRMIYDAPAHLVAVVCKYDVTLAAEIASVLHRKCRRRLHLSMLASALSEHGVQVARVRSTFKILAPEVNLKKPRKGEEPRDEFVTGGDPLPEDPIRLQIAVHQRIERSSYGTGLHTLTAVIKALLGQGKKEDALSVFGHLENALRNLVKVYPISGQ